MSGLIEEEGGGGGGESLGRVNRGEILRVNLFGKDKRGENSASPPWKSSFPE